MPSWRRIGLNCSPMRCSPICSRRAPKPPTPTPRSMCCRRFWRATARRCRRPPPNVKPQIRCYGSLRPPTCTKMHWAPPPKNHLGATRLDKLATLADTLYPRLTHAEGWPVLRNHLALLACAGHNPAAALSQAVANGGLDDAGDPTAVLKLAHRPHRRPFGRGRPVALATCRARPTRR